MGFKISAIPFYCSIATTIGTSPHFSDIDLSVDADLETIAIGTYPTGTALYPSFHMTAPVGYVIGKWDFVYKLDVRAYGRVTGSSAAGNDLYIGATFAGANSDVTLDLTTGANKSWCAYENLPIAAFKAKGAYYASQYFDAANTFRAWIIAQLDATATCELGMVEFRLTVLNPRNVLNKVNFITSGV